MKSVIFEMLDGKCCCLDKMASSEDYRKLLKEVENQYDKLLNGLTEEQKTMLEALYNLMIELQAETSTFHYREGFKLGISVVFEALDQRSD